MILPARPKHHDTHASHLPSILLMAASCSVCLAAGAEPFELPSPVRQVGVGRGAVEMQVALDSDAYRAIAPRSRIRIREFPVGNDETLDLDLESFNVTSPATRIVAGTDEGDVLLPHPEVTLLRGRIAGENDSDVFLGLSPSICSGYVRRGQREFVLAPERTAATADPIRHVIHEFASTHRAGQAPSFECLTSGPAEELAVAVPNAVGSSSWRVAAVAIDCDYEFGQLFDGLGEASVYAIELLGAISSLYERDLQVRLHIPYLRIWSTTNDPYTADNVGVLLGELESEWRNNMTSVNRSLVHLLSGEPGRAGLAEVDVLCDEYWGYGVSAGLLGSFPRPVPPNDSGPIDTFDLKIVAHEMGHQFGSPHTHCYSPPIDYCGRSFDDCWSGTFQCQQGTIMSYCDRTECIANGGGKDLRFHDRVITRIRQSVNASCLPSGMDPVFVDWANNTGGENGSSAFPFNTILEGIQVVIPGGSIHISTGLYPETIIANRAMTLNPDGGSVVIGP